MITREQVVDAARSWVGTPFGHQQRTKGVAVDCIGLLIGIGRELGMVDESFDVTGYTGWPDGKTLIAGCEEHMTKISRSEMQPGDAIVVSFDSDPQHFGILAPYRHGGLAVIHAASKYGKVVETRLMFGSTPLSMKFVAAYRLPGVV